MIQVLKRIPEEFVINCFQLSRTKYIEKFDERLQTHANPEEWLQTVYERYTEWRDNGLTHLPSFVAVPHNSISRLFQFLLNDGNVLFGVRKISGDGNCLYRSLALSPQMESIIPPDVPSKHQYIRKKLYEFAKGNHMVTHRI